MARPIDRDKYSNAFNSMPYEQRKIAVDSEMIARIQDLEYLKDRLKLNYQREIRWINERIKNYQSGLK